MSRNPKFTGNGFALLVTERKGDGWVIVKANANELNINGYTSDELIGQDPADCFDSPETNQDAIVLAQKTVEQGKSACFCARLKSKDGTPYAIRCMVSGEYNEQGEIYRYHYLSTVIDDDDPSLKPIGRSDLMAKTEKMSGTGSWRYSKAFCELLVTDNLYALLDLDASRHKTTDLIDKIPEKLARSISKSTFECLDTGEPFSVNYRFTLDNGSELYGTIAGAAEFDATGDITAVIGVIRDLSAQADLRIEHEMFLRAARIGSLQVDHKKGQITLSPQAAKLLGEEEKMFVMPIVKWRARIHPDDFEKANAIYDHSLYSAEASTRSYRFRHQDGSWRWIEIRSHTRLDKAGNPVIMYATLMDVNDRVMAERKIAESEQRFNDVLGRTNEAVFEADGQGRLTYVSEQAPVIFGYSSEELLNMSAFDIMANKPDTYKEWLASESMTSDTMDGEREFIKKDGTHIIVNISAMALFDQNHKIIGYRGAARDITEEKKIRAKLEISEQRFQDILGHSREAIFEMDAQGKFIYVSDLGPEVLGYSHKELMSMKAEDLYAKDNAHAQNWFKERKNQGDLVTEREMRTKDGTAIFIDMNSNPVFNKDGELTGYRGTARDVTEQRKIQIKLEVSEKRFKEVISNADGCVFEIDANGCFTYVSETSKDLFGYQPDEMLGKPTYILSHEEPPEGHEAWVKALHEAGGFTVQEQKFVKKNGTSGYWLRVSSHAIYDERGRIIGFRGAAFDITERKRADEKIRENQQRLKEVVSAANGWIFDLDETGNFTYASKEISNLMGYSSADLIGKPTWILAPEMKHLQQYWLQEMRDTEVGTTVEFLLGDKKTWIEIHCIARRDEDKNCFGFRGVAFDITLKKEVEKATMRAKEEAEAAAEERARFLATMSHEIRTPLNAVIGMTGLLLDSKQDAEQAKLTKTANMAGHHLLSLVNDILDHSKLDAGKVMLEEIAFDLVQEISNVQEILNTNAEQKSIDFSVSTDGLLTHQYVGDPARLRQILLNLTGNSIKFTENGQVTIKVKSTNKDHIRFEVTDNGIGISEQAQKHLFEEFSQADASTTRKHGGTGLGLAICKRLVGIMNGKIGVISKLGEGSTFWFEIPLPASKPSLTKSSTQTDIISDLEETRSFNILIAEDNPANQLLIRTILEKFDQNVTIVENGQLAIEALAANKYDLVFMDIQMPIMDGYTATKTIRDQGDRTPIIALTANDLRDEEHNFRAAGMSDWLSKPISMADLITKMYYWGNSDCAQEEQTSPKQHVEKS